MDADRRIAELARVQKGIVTYAQLMGAGVTDDEVRHRRRSGALTTVHRGVFAVSGAPTSWEQRLLAACLAAGAETVASHRAACRLWGIEVPDDDAIEITASPGSRPRLAGVLVHRLADPPRVVIRQGIPATDQMRALVDLGAVAPPWAVRNAVDQARSRKLVSVKGLRRALEEVADRGRNGAGVLRAVLEDVAPLAGRTESMLEARIQRLFERAGGLQPVWQYDVFAPSGRWLGRADGAYPDASLLIEADSYQFHTDPEPFKNDRRRWNRFKRAGYEVLNYTWDDVIERKGDIVLEVREVRHDRLHLFRTASGA